MLFFIDEASKVKSCEFGGGRKNRTSSVELKGCGYQEGVILVVKVLYMSPNLE